MGDTQVLKHCASRTHLHSSRTCSPHHLKSRRSVLTWTCMEGLGEHAEVPRNLQNLNFLVRTCSRFVSKSADHVLTTVHRKHTSEP
jgi:hypothetical protein